MSRVLRPVRILVSLPHISAGHTPIALVKALNYDREEGLELEFRNVGSPTAGVEGVLCGEGDATFVNTSFCLFCRDRGEPLRAFFGYVARPVRSFVVPADSQIRSLKDLKGARIGVDFPDLLDFAKAALADAGLDPQRDVSFEVRPMYPLEREQLTSAVRAGSVQALFLFDLNEGFFELAGIPLRHLRNETLPGLTPGSCLHTSDETLRFRADVLGSLGRAVARATLFTMTNPEAAIRHLWGVIPETHPAPGDQARALERDMAILRPRIANHRREQSPDARWGAITEQEFSAWQEMLLRSGGIKSRRDPRQYFTNDLVDDFNDFNPAAVVRQAKHSSFPAALH